jgi:RimJ/RimL family protein N-acetyltransferase
MDLFVEDGGLTPVLRTKRLTLRPVNPADAPAIVAGVNDWDVAKWLAVVPHPYTDDDAHSFISEIVPSIPKLWAIDDAQLVGIISIDTEIGYWLARDRWGRGYMTEAARAVVAHHFADPAAENLLSGHFVGNERSGAVLAKLGFVNLEVRRIYSLARGEDVDSQKMILTRANWETGIG